jgi:hypothetical protein
MPVGPERNYLRLDLIIDISKQIMVIVQYDIV